MLRQIGLVRVDYPDEYVRENAGKVDGRVEIFPEYSGALLGIEEYSHVFLIAFLHKQPSNPPLVIKPRKLLRLGFKEDELPSVGVFASDSPLRPNPIALTLVRLVSKRGNVLNVEGLDLFDMTPILDIKPYRNDYRAKSFRTPKWVTYEEREPLD